MQEYVRGARLDAVLHHRARVFQDSVGSSASFAMSTEVDRLSAFLSHTWSTPRYKTFMALCLHYNANVAFVAVLTVGLLLSVGIAFELLPLVKMAESSRNTNPAAPYATVVCSIVFQLVLHMAHEVLPNSSRVFLDKLCIHQTDTERKLDGVAHLGLTMFFSSTMIVLDSESYFNRLWTVYELASCLVVDSGKPIVFLPVNLPVHLHGAGAVICFATVLHFLLNTAWAHETFPILKGASAAVLVLLLLPGFAIVTVVLRRWAREQARRKTRLQSFSIRDSECTDERDRQAVYANIVNLIEDAEEFPNGLSPDEALVEFDNTVRERMPGAMDTSGVRLIHCWIIGVPLFCRAFDYLGADLAAGASPRYAAIDFCFFASSGLLFLPECVWLMEKCTKRCLGLTGVVETMYMFMLLIVALLFTLSWATMNSKLAVEAEQRDVMVGAYVFFLLLQVALVVVLFRGSRASPGQHRVSCVASQQAAQQFRFGMNLSSSLDTPPAAPPSIPDEEPSPLPQSMQSACESDVAVAPNVIGKYRRRARL